MRNFVKVVLYSLALHLLLFGSMVSGFSLDPMWMLTMVPFWVFTVAGSYMVFSRLSPGWRRMPEWAAFLWFSAGQFMGYIILFIVGAALAAGVYDAFSYEATVLALGCGAVVSVYAGLRAVWRPLTVRTVELSCYTAQEGRGSSGESEKNDHPIAEIVVIADLHFSPVVTPRLLRHIVRTVNELSPDIVVLPGDVVSGFVRHLAPYLEELRNIRPPSGVFVVTGNDDYHYDPEEWKACFTSHFGWTVLSNSVVDVQVGARRIRIAGIEDRCWLRGRSAANGDPRMMLVEQQAEELGMQTDVSVLLAHRPDDVDVTQHPWVDLQISGHTHGGHIWPLNWLNRFLKPMCKGLYSFGTQYVYVTEGVGFGNPPLLRLGTRYEISRIVVKEEAV